MAIKQLVPLKQSCWAAKQKQAGLYTGWGQARAKETKAAQERCCVLPCQGLERRQGFGETSSGFCNKSFSMHSKVCSEIQGFLLIPANKGCWPWKTEGDRSQHFPAAPSGTNIAPNTTFYALCSIFSTGCAVWWCPRDALCSIVFRVIMTWEKGIGEAASWKTDWTTF